MVERLQLFFTDVNNMKKTLNDYNSNSSSGALSGIMMPSDSPIPGLFKN
jgi:hypothetical protein